MRMLGYQPDDDWSRPDKSDDNTGDKSLSRWWALPTLVVGAFITFLVHQVASFARAEAAVICSGVLFIVIVSIWRFHRERWFWPFLIGTAVFEGIAIWLIPWPPNHEFQK